MIQPLKLILRKVVGVMINCNDWIEFELFRLFTIKSPASRSMKTYTEGTVPYVSSGGVNNGVVSYLEPKENEELEKGNCITVSPLEGTPAFYQEIDFLGRGGAGSAISMLYNDNLTKYNALFICTVVKICAAKFDYSDAFTSDNLKTLKMPLPAQKNTDGTLYVEEEKKYCDEGYVPDWEFMSNYMMSIEKKSQNRIDILKQVSLL